MIALISPAKSLDFSPQTLTSQRSQPTQLKDSEELIALLRGFKPEDLQSLMGISPKLAALNHERFQVWKRPFNTSNAKQALLAFRGDVYRGFSLDAYTEDDFAFAQDHLRILSGLHGVLRPMDLIQPYRLEMGTKLENERGRDLYAYWGNKITDRLNRDLKAQEDDVLVNLASNEYFSAVNTDRLKARVITPVFKDYKNGKLKIISFFAKKARGMMSDFIIRRRLRRPSDLKKFNTAGYEFDAERSHGDELLFTRAEGAGGG